MLKFNMVLRLTGVCIGIVLVLLVLAPLLYRGEHLLERETALAELGQRYLLPAYTAGNSDTEFYTFRSLHAHVSEIQPGLTRGAAHDSINPFPGLLPDDRYGTLPSWNSEAEQGDIPVIWWDGSDPYGLTVALYLDGTTKLVPDWKLREQLEGLLTASQEIPSDSLNR